MKHRIPLTLALLMSLGGSAAIAASTAASSASDSATSSAGSASDSVHGSSNSSSGKTNVAAGDYRLIEVTQAAGRPDALRMTLVRHDDAKSEVSITLPREAFAKADLQLGHTVAVRDKPYGIELANARTEQAFFLVLDDAWHRELISKPVTL